MDDEQPFVVTPIKACRVCQSGGITPILNFGLMPLANRYLMKPTDEEIRAPLEVVLCKNCGCVQLAHMVDPKVLFSDYCYTSSTSGTLSYHFEKYARDTVEKLSLKAGKDFIVGIGGNDGPLEKAFQSLGFKVLNVEPSENIAKLSVANGVPTWADWFNEETADNILKAHWPQASLITCNNCFAHMPDIHEVVRGIKTLLKPDGWFVSEEGYWLDAVCCNHFDRVYHEHVFYWTVRALDRLFPLHGLNIYDIEHNDSQGGSIRAFVQHGKDNRCDAVPKTFDAVELEETAGLFDEATYEQWTKSIKAWRDACWIFLKPIESVCCYGVPAKFTMLSQQLEFTPQRIAYAVEDSPIKVGRFTPGSHIPIVNRQHFLDHPTEHCIIIAANYADLIVKSNPQYKGKWIVLTPEPRIL